MDHILVQFMSQMTSLTDEEKLVIKESFPIRTFDKGHLILKEGMIANDAFYVINGCIREYELNDGAEVTTASYTENKQDYSTFSHSFTHYCTRIINCDCI